MSAYLHLPVVPAGIAGTQGTGTYMASCVLDAGNPCRHDGVDFDANGVDEAVLCKKLQARIYP